MSLGSGPEIEFDLDAAAGRIWITGWKGEDSRRSTQLFLPLSLRGKDLLLTLGGFGLFDFRHMIVLLNGHEVGVRHALKRWNEPGVFEFGPGSDAYEHVRFGQENVISVQLADMAVRTERLNKLDPRHAKHFNRNRWPGQFEQYLTIGTPVDTPRLRVTKVQDNSKGDSGEAVVELQSEGSAVSVVVVYRWSAADSILHKSVEITNDAERDLTLMHLRLGEYETDASVSEGEQGFPVYLGGEFFMSLAHPSGWAIGQEGQVALRQYPGRTLPPSATFRSMEAVFGVAQAGEARETFLNHVRSRSRRVLRRHDKPYAIFEPFGARLGGDFDETEEFLLDNIAKLAQGQRETGCHFDYYSIDFWVDSMGDIKGFDPQRFPGGLDKINPELAKLGTAPGLWITGTKAEWSIGDNPAVRPCWTHDPAQGLPIGATTQIHLCRATDPVKTMYSSGFRHHIRENGVRLCKFDGTWAICYNPNHDHLPGVYSTEAIQTAIIETLHDLDAECPDVFLMLYWGHRSPWWLLHADTLFESGLAMEARDIGPAPALYVRDSVTLGLDQAVRWCEDVPLLGQDSLGIWLSDWPWNSYIGKERWQEGFVMDICRGSMLAQPWSDYEWLSTEERMQIAEFIALLRARPECFGNPRFVLGDPWRDEPYGYCCSDGERAFIALNNCTWSDAALQLELNSAWGLPDHRQWELYRWYPHPAKLQGERATFGERASISLRPFEVVLLEAVPQRQSPSLERAFDVEPIPSSFAEPSRPLELAIAQPQTEPEPVSDSAWTVFEPLSFESAGGATLTRQRDGSILAGGENPSSDTYTITANTDLVGITAIRLEVLPHATLPAGGPGRAINGNFALTEFRVTATPQGQQAAVPVTLRKPVADFSQDMHGEWPVAATIDGDLNTGWSVHPEEGCAHVAVFATDPPAGSPGGTTLTFTLRHGDRQHNLGRLRLSGTTVEFPIPFPKGYGPRPLAIRGKVPASQKGGTLAFTNLGRKFPIEGTVAGKAAPFEQVDTKRCRWQAWRLCVEPSTLPQEFELVALTGMTANELEKLFKAYFVPN
jgi:hypothetical protein